MICNECATKQCKHKVYQTDRGRWTCPDHKKPQGSWSMLELALGNSPQAVHDLLQQHGLKFKERHNARY
jgi:hypothetical protein